MWGVNCIVIRSAQPEPSVLQIILTNTQLRPVTLVPEIRLHQATEPIGVWQRTELAAGRTGLDPPFWAFAWAGGQALARYLLDHPETVKGLARDRYRLRLRARGHRGGQGRSSGRDRL